MEIIKLGKSDLKIAPIVLGGNVFGWTLNKEQSFDILDRFVDLGFNAIDTADVYSRWAPENSGGESETIIGQWLKERNNREKVVIFTKVGSDMGQGHRDLTKDYILREIEESLKRLQTDYIDLYFTHFDDEKTPVEETLSAYDQLVKQGKVRWIGASNMSVERLTESLETSKDESLPRYQVFQPGYNLYDREKFENGVCPVCREHGLGVVTYFSLASGFLTGKYRSTEDFKKSVRGGKMDQYLNERGKRILEALDQLANDHHTTPAAISLSWLIHKDGISAPIASATKASHLSAFADAADLPLTDGDMEILDEASSYTEIIN